MAYLFWTKLTGTWHEMATDQRKCDGISANKENKHSNYYHNSLRLSYVTPYHYGTRQGHHKSKLTIQQKRPKSNSIGGLSLGYGIIVHSCSAKSKRMIQFLITSIINWPRQKFTCFYSDNRVRTRCKGSLKRLFTGFCILAQRNVYGQVTPTLNNLGPRRTSKTTPQ